MVQEFVAQARITLANPPAVIAPVCDHMVEHGGDVEKHDGVHIVRFANGLARFCHEDDVTLIDMAAASLEDLYHMRSMVASHILEFADGEAPVIEWTGDGGDLARPPNFRIL